jgi:hypothetical protein
MYKGEDDWDRDELSELKHAVQEVPSSVEKQERWRRIADIVGTRNKGEVRRLAFSLLPKMCRYLLHFCTPCALLRCSAMKSTKS